MPFIKNDPNINRSGRPLKGEAWTEVIREISNRVEENSGKHYKELVAQALVDRAISGDVSAIREFGDRLEGRSKQMVEQSISAKLPIPILGGLGMEFVDMSEKGN